MRIKRFLVILAALLSGISLELRAEPCAPISDQPLLSALLPQAPGLRPEVLKLALDSAACAAKRGLVRRNDVLTVIDYSLASSQKRLFVFDLQSQRILFHELVAHGKNSGGDVATHFSNSSGSLATSLGLFVTEGTYVGGNGYSLRLRGLEEGVNDMAWDRLIVMHGAYYVSQEAIRALGRLGRSWGCPAVRSEIAQELIDTVRGGSAIFAYYPDKKWLSASHFIPAPASSSPSTQVASR